LGPIFIFNVPLLRGQEPFQLLKLFQYLSTERYPTTITSSISNY
jgi:hypothetical protein